MTNSEDQWVPVPGHSGYEIDSLGRVRSWRRKGPGARRSDTPVTLSQKSASPYRSAARFRPRWKAPANDFIMERSLGLDGDSCVIWPFRLRDGYGVVSTPRPERKIVLAHRLVLEAAGFTPSEEQTDTRHLCGVRACVNLNHLRFGTRSENQMDRFHLHGGSNAGERNGRAKLTDRDVREIRASNETDEVLAARYSVSRTTINFAKNRITWSHLD